MPEPERERWFGRTAFVMAAIGSAVGLGNVWRFPYLAYSGGGGAFFLPYFLSICFIGWPLLTLELALGQVYQTGDINCFGKMNRRLRGIGFGSVWAGFMIVCYYVVIIGWAMIMLINVSREPWLGNEDGPVNNAAIGDQGFVDTCKIDEGDIVQDSDAATQYFFAQVVGLERGRGFDCFLHGTTYERKTNANWGVRCEGIDYNKLPDGSFTSTWGNWNAPCYDVKEKDDGVCTSDAQCEGTRVCDATMKPAVDVSENLKENPHLGTCQGPPRDGDDGTCNPCQQHKEEGDCWADEDTPGMDCYWYDGSCKTGKFRKVAPYKKGGYHECLDEGYVFEWGPAYRCAFVAENGLCGADVAKQRCPDSCNACEYVHIEQTCDQGAHGFIGTTYAAIVVTWLLVFLCLAFGIKITGLITYFTMTVPFILIVVLFFAGVTLDGADEGARQYFGKWQMSDLRTNTRLWADAAGQTFFTLSIGFGIMTAYASYNTRNQNTVVDAVIIVFADTLTAFIAGFTVFCIIGNFAFKKGVAFEDVGAIGGLSLAFRTYPVALSKLSGGAAWCAVFFFTLIMLGIDSAFSIVEGVVTALKDSRRFNKVPRLVVVLSVAIVGLVFGLFYCLDTGLYLLDAVDYYLNNISLLFVGLMQCIAAGWVYGWDAQARVVGGRALGVFNFAFFAAVVIGAETAFYTTGKDGAVMGLSVGIWLALAGACLSFGLMDRTLQPQLSDGERAWALWMGNIEQLRDELNAVLVPEGSKNSRIPQVWSVLIKFFIPAALCCIFSITFQTSFGYYENYAGRYQAAGLVISFLTVIFVAVGILFPDVFDPFSPPDGHYAETPDDIAARARRANPSVPAGKLAGIEEAVERRPDPELALAAAAGGNGGGGGGGPEPVGNSGPAPQMVFGQQPQQWHPMAAQYPQQPVPPGMMTGPPPPVAMMPMHPYAA